MTSISILMVKFSLKHSLERFKYNIFACLAFNSKTLFFSQPDEVATSDDVSSEEIIADLHPHKGILTRTLCDNISYETGDR